MTRLNTASMDCKALLKLTFGLTLMLIQLVLPSKKKTVGLADANGDFITISFTMPIILKLSGLRNRGFQCINSPTGFFIFINFAADSLIMKHEESLEKSREKSLPSTNCQP